MATVSVSYLWIALEVRGAQDQERAAQAKRFFGGRAVPIWPLYAFLAEYYLYSFCVFFILVQNRVYILEYGKNMAPNRAYILEYSLYSG